MKKNVFRKIWKYLADPRLFYVRYATKKLSKASDGLDDEDYLKRLYKIHFGHELDLKNPQTFNEKLQWLKLHNRKDAYTTMVDKHAAKGFVRSLCSEDEIKIAEELGCYESADDIDFNSLPDKFVLKTTHGCGGMVICKDKSKLDIPAIKKMLNDSLKDNYYTHCREWPYKNVPHRIIAEAFLSDGVNDALPVYKFFCFNGEPHIAQVITNDKRPNETIDYIDMDYNKLKLKQNFPNSKHQLPKPKQFEKMKDICRILTKGIPFVRCDLYDVNGDIYFSEFTFFSDAGITPFHPKKWDLELGRMIELNVR